MPAVQLQHISKTYRGGVPALRDCSLQVAAGELLSIVGPSGSGKTTLLRIVAGLERPTGGTLLLRGQVADRMPPHRRRVGMVFQDAALYPHLTVRGNLEFPLRMRRAAPGTRQQRVADVAALLGLGPLLDRRPHELSGGQRQRVAIGRALVGQPDVLLLDEPLAQLDAPARCQLREEIARLHQRTATTMLYVSHDQAEALALGQRVAVLVEGCLLQVARPDWLYRHPAHLRVAEFLGAPGMNLVAGMLHLGGEAGPYVELAGHRLLVPESLAARCPVLRHFADRPVVVGLRAEALRPAVSSPAARAAAAAVVERVEYLGHESLAYVRSEALASHPLASPHAITHRLVVRWPADAPRPTPGSAISLEVDTREVCLFDPAGPSLDAAAARGSSAATAQRPP
jgi:multiple sugar transport system ATP-binding protein